MGEHFYVFPCVNYLIGMPVSCINVSQALSDMMAKKSKAKWGNWIGYILIPFNIGSEDDPLDYVRKAKATIDCKKLSLEAIITFACAELILKLFGVKVHMNLSA